MERRALANNVIAGQHARGSESPTQHDSSTESPDIYPNLGIQLPNTCYVQRRAALL